MAFSYSPKIVTDGLILCLDAANPYSYVSGSLNWNDLSRGGSNSTLINGPTFDSGSGGNIVFNGINNYGNGTLTPLSGSAFTIGTWIKPIVSPNEQVYFSIGTIPDRDQSIHLRLINNTTIRFGMYISDLDADNFTPMSGSWNYIVCTLDNFKLQSIYQNSVFKNSGTAFGMFVGNNSYYVGVWGVLGIIQYINANIGPIHVYNRALSQTEITQNFNAQKSRFGF